MIKNKKCKRNYLNKRLSNELIKTVIQHTRKEKEILISFLCYKHDYLKDKLELKLANEPPKFFRNSHDRWTNEVKYLKIQINIIFNALEREWEYIRDLSSLIEDNQ